MGVDLDGNARPDGLFCFGVNLAAAIFDILDFTDLNACLFHGRAGFKAANIRVINVQAYALFKSKVSEDHNKRHKQRQAKQHKRAHLHFNRGAFGAHN